MAGALRATPGTIEHLVGYTAFFAGAFGFGAWSKYASRRRKERFSLGPVFGAGFVGFMMWVVWCMFLDTDNAPASAMFALAGTAGVVQMVSPWTPPPPPQPKRRRLEYA
jgi:hypothetical protein